MRKFLAFALLIVGPSALCLSGLCAMSAVLAQQAPSQPVDSQTTEPPTGQPNTSTSQTAPSGNLPATPQGVEVLARGPVQQHIVIALELVGPELGTLQHRQRESLLA